MALQPSLKTNPKHASAKPYVIGFVLSVLLTLESYFLVEYTGFPTPTIITIIVILAIVQLLVQMFFFLHLDRINKNPWHVMMFVLMGIVVCTIVFGSIWIMNNLKYGHQNSAAEAAEYLKKDEGYR